MSSRQWDTTTTFDQLESAEEVADYATNVSSYSSAADWQYDCNGSARSFLFLPAAFTDLETLAFCLFLVSFFIFFSGCLC